MAVTDYKLTIDDSDVTKVLKSLEGRFVSMEKTGDEAMKGVGKSGINMSNVLSGAVGGAFVGIAGAALEFGKAGISAFADVVKASTQAAIEFDVTEKKFVSIFEGREDEAKAVMDSIGQRASSLGLELNEALSLSRSFIPDVKGTEDPLGAIDDLLVGVRALAEEDPVQGIIGARVAIDEAMSGSLRSLKARFEFTKAETDILEKAQTELGQVVGTIEGINEVMQRRGVDVEAMKGTFTQAMGEMQFAVSKLQIEMGKPIADQMTESLGQLGAIVQEKSGDLSLLAGSIGDVVANVVDFISTNVMEFLGDFDVAGLQEAVAAFGSMVNQVLVLADILLDLEMGDGIFDDITWFFGKIEQALETLNQIVAIIKAASSAVSAFTDSLNIFGERAAEPTTILGNFEVNLPTFNKDFLDFGKGAAEAQTAFKDSILDSVDAIDKGNERLQKNADAHDERVAALNADSSAALESAEAYLKLGGAAGEAQSELEKLGLTEEQITDIHKISADTVKKRNDLEARFSQQRADNHRKALDEIENIEADYKQNVAAAGIDLGRDGRDMAIKQGAERSDLEKGLRRQLLDVELQYQAELKRIARDTQLSLESAEVNQDAIAFVDALRQQEIAEEEAAIRRDQGEADAQDTYEQQLVDLEEAQAVERATLQQSYADKLEDLQASLAQEFADQEIANQRRDEQQALSEQRQLDALAQAQDQKLNELTKGLDDETAAVVKAEAAKLAAIEDFSKQAQAKLNQLAESAKSMSAGSGARGRRIGGEGEDAGMGSTPSTSRGRPSGGRIGGEREGAGIGSDNNGPRRITAGERRRFNIPPSIRFATPSVMQRYGMPRKFGGRVTAGQTYTVGEAGPEIYRTFNPTPRRFGGKVTAGQPYMIGEIGPEGYLPHRKLGGGVLGGQPTMVGELGQEIFLPPASGEIIPNSQIDTFRGQQQQVSNSSTEIDFNPTFELSNPAVLSPEQAAMTKSIAASVAAQMFQRVFGGTP